MEDNKETKNKEEEKSLYERLNEETEKSIETLLNDGITMENVKTLSELVDIHKDILEERKEKYNMYGNYNGNYNGYNNYNYGNYGRDSYGREQYGENYGRRGRDSRYRGYEHLDKMYNEYGRYSDGREQYGANEDTKKSLKYMLECMDDFVRMLKEEAQSQEEVQMIRQTAQRIAQM